MLAWGHRGFAQQSVDYGSIGGGALDPSGAVVAGAGVAARQVDTNVATTAITDASGRFRLASLRIGRYELTVRQPGFTDAVVQLTVTAGAAFEIPVSLTLAS